MPVKDLNQESVILKLLAFQMFTAGYTQDEIAAYAEKSKTTINTMLKPLQEKKGKDAK
ncbi:MAG: hypothetical protein ACLP7O_01255 [Terracidiphilus sp.]